MANLTLKDVPDQIHADLKIAARSAGKSLNTYIISLLELSTDERWRRRTMREQCCENNAARTMLREQCCENNAARTMMREQREPFRKFLETLPPMTDSTSILQTDRERGH